MSSALSGLAVVIHSGGPTSVINASLLGVVEESSRHPEITGILGACFGVSGILQQNFIDLAQESTQRLAAVARTPASALGSSRREISDQEFQSLIEIFRTRNIRFVFYTGGNGSMATAHQIHDVALQSNYPLQVVGIPKTIDNDLMHTDHSPGYGSAARFFAHAVRDIGLDNWSLGGQVEVIEVLGRNVGWIAAATVLARRYPEDAPHLIYLPETPLAEETLLDDVNRVYSRIGRCVLVVCEGQLDAKGQPFGADVRPGSRGSLAMNLGHTLAMLISKKLKIRARSEKPGLLGRSNSQSISQTDWDEAHLCGRHAVIAAIEGLSDCMISLVRSDLTTSYLISTSTVSLASVAFTERPFPAEWRVDIPESIPSDFYRYVSPLAGEITACERLAGHPAFTKDGF